MSEEQQTITKPEPKERIKNPKRVAQGYRLAEMSRNAKAQKKEALQKQHEEEILQLSDISTSLTIVGVVTGVIGTYIAWRRFRQETKDNKKITKKHSSPPKVEFNNLDNDDI